VHAVEAKVVAGVPFSELPLRWVAGDELAGLAMPRANRKIIEALAKPAL
jgi:hypothetical protein